MGYLLESFVVQQLVAQSAWTDPDLRFWHYRDKDRVEVDLVVTRGRKVWGLEVTAVGTLAACDGRGLVRLTERYGEDFQQGLLLYVGEDLLPLADKLSDRSNGPRAPPLHAPITQPPASPSPALS